VRPPPARHVPVPKDDSALQLSNSTSSMLSPSAPACRSRNQSHSANRPFRRPCSAWPSSCCSSGDLPIAVSMECRGRDWSVPPKLRLIFAASSNAIWRLPRSAPLPSGVSCSSQNRSPPRSDASTDTHGSQGLTHKYHELERRVPTASDDLILTAPQRGCVPHEMMTDRPPVHYRTERAP